MSETVMEEAASSRASARRSREPASDALAVAQVAASSSFVGYTSDLEGGWEAWKIYLRRSKVLSYDEDTHTITLNDNCIFIHGGDVCDRGCGDLRILQDLIKLKRDYPDRVFFVIGNRDANKLRLPFSLHDRVVSLPAQAYWVPPTTGAEEGAVLDRTARLKWVLKYTMGAPFAFECHREELREMGRPHSDDDVVRSFLDLVTPGHPDSLVLQYLECAQMSVIVEDTIYVHGAINSYYLSWVPPKMGDRSKAHTLVPELAVSNVSLDVFQWTKEINAFVASEVADYKANYQLYLQMLSDAEPTAEAVTAMLWDCIGHYGHPQPGSRLAQCGMGALPDKSENPGVMYGGYVVRGEPVPLADNAALWLKCDGITKIIVGHQPNGDAPFFMDQHGVQAVSADTSYSKGVLYRKRDLFRSPLFTSNVAGGSNPSASSPPTVPNDVYCTIDTFIKEELAPQVEITTSVNPVPSTPAAVMANTRILPAVSEVCVEYPSLPKVFVGAASVRPGDMPVVGRLYVHGRLAQGSDYAFVVPPSAANSFIGKKTSENWFVKVPGVLLEGQPHFLLAHSKGFEFRDRFVAESEIDKEGLVAKRH